MKSLFVSISQHLQLSKEEVNVFLELLTHGRLSMTELSEFTELSDKQIKASLETLKRRKLVYFHKNSDDLMYFTAPSEKQIYEKFHSNALLLDSLYTFAPRIKTDNRIGILRYEGWEGIQKVYNEVLEEAIKTNDDIYAFESNIEKSKIDQNFLDNYFYRRNANKVKAYVITPGTAADTQYKTQHEGAYTQVKTIKDLNIDANVNIVGNLVMTFSINEPKGTLQRDISSANTWKAVFEKLWNL